MFIFLRFSDSNINTFDPNLSMPSNRNDCGYSENKVKHNRTLKLSQNNGSFLVKINSPKKRNNALLTPYTCTASAGIEKNILSKIHNIGNINKNKIAMNGHNRCFSYYVEQVE
jgi:hypothetical protein